jgi:hypothetical protein
MLFSSELSRQTCQTRFISVLSTYVCTYVPGYALQSIETIHLGVEQCYPDLGGKIIVFGKKQTLVTSVFSTSAANALLDPTYLK